MCIRRAIGYMPQAYSQSSVVLAGSPLFFWLMYTGAQQKQACCVSTLIHTLAHCPGKTFLIVARRVVAACAQAQLTAAAASLAASSRLCAQRS
jgi:hypothetical protein